MTLENGGLSSAISVSKDHAVMGFQEIGSRVSFAPEFRLIVDTRKDATGQTELTASCSCGCLGAQQESRGYQLISGLFLSQ